MLGSSPGHSEPELKDTGVKMVCEPGVWMRSPRQSCLKDQSCQQGTGTLASDGPRLLGWPQSWGWHRVLSVGHEAEEIGKGLSVDAVAPEASPGGLPEEEGPAEDSEEGL